MSSRSRNETLERILAAKYDLESCEDSKKASYAQELESLINGVLEKHPGLSRNDLLEAIALAYREYKAAQLNAQRRRMSL